MPSEIISLPVTEDIHELRKSVEVALKRLAVRVHDGTITTDLDLTNHQIKNVSWPVGENDAVTVAYLKDLVKVQGSGNLTRMQKYMLQINSVGTSTVVSAPEWTRVESTLAVATTTVGGLITPVVGQYFSLLLHQDATGGRLVDWGTGTFRGMSGWQPETTASTFSSFLFYCKASNNFQLLAPPVTGVS